MPSRLLSGACLLLALLPLIVLGPGRAAAQAATPDVASNTYTSPTYGYAFTWDDSWAVVADRSKQGVDELSLYNGSGFVTVFGGWRYPALTACVADDYRSLKNDKTNSDVRPVLDAAGAPIKGGDASHAFAVYRFTHTAPDGSTVDLIDSLDCRPVPGAPDGTMILIVGDTLAENYPIQAPVVDGLLAGLVLPSPGEHGPAFVAGPWRVSIVAAVRGAAVPTTGLKAKTGKDWLLVAADVTDWSTTDHALAVTNFGVRLDAGAKPVGLAVKTTAGAAAKLGGATADGSNAIAFTAGQTQRVVLVFQLPRAGAGPTLTLSGAALPLAGPLAQAPKLAKLPAVVGPPHLRQATVTKVLDGDILLATLSGDATGPWTIALIGVEPAAHAACFADKGAAALKKLARKGAMIWIEADANGKDSDVLARYVWVVQADGAKTLLNAQVLAGGFVRPAALAPDARFGAWLAETARGAQAAKAGLWSACAGTPANATPAAPTPVAGNSL